MPGICRQNLSLCVHQTQISWMTRLGRLDNWISQSNDNKPTWQENTLGETLELCMFHSDCWSKRHIVMTVLGIYVMCSVPLESLEQVSPASLSFRNFEHLEPGKNTNRVGGWAISEKHTGMNLGGRKALLNNYHLGWKRKTPLEYSETNLIHWDNIKLKSIHVISWEYHMVWNMLFYFHLKQT